MATRARVYTVVTRPCSARASSMASPAVEGQVVTCARTICCFLRPRLPCKLECTPQASSFHHNESDPAAAVAQAGLANHSGSDCLSLHRLSNSCPAARYHCSTGWTRPAGGLLGSESGGCGGQAQLVLPKRQHQKSMVSIQVPSFYAFTP